MGGTADSTVEVFYSYSHKDEKLRDELQNHLSVLKRNGVIADWHDRKIGAGTEWKGHIDQHLNTSQVILLFVSSDFLASDYCYDIELERVMKRHEADEARVIPIILRPCDWHAAPFGKLQALPKDGKPVTRWSNKDEAFTDISKGIREVVEQLQGIREPVQRPAGKPSEAQEVSGHSRPTDQTRGRRFDQAEAVRILSNLAESDMATLIAAIPHARRYVAGNTPIPQQAAGLVQWAVSETGPGLEEVWRIGQKVLPNFPQARR